MRALAHKATRLRPYSVHASTSTIAGNGGAPLTILRSVEDVRLWRRERRSRGEDVGMVPTMGALHEGHLSLGESPAKPFLRKPGQDHLGGGHVLLTSQADCFLSQQARASMAQNTSTLLSIFVNPAQFAPHEDLATYPRTVDADLKLLSDLSMSVPSVGTRRQVDAVWIPPVEALYPGGITTDVKAQRGAFVEVKGLQDVMEGASRPGFFRGVATVVTKLFNIVEPTRAYFGQKDIQQCLLLRRLLSDLHCSHPFSRDLVILPTARDPKSGLALSSRNAYLSDAERRFSTVVYDALQAGSDKWRLQRAGDSSISSSSSPSSGGGEVFARDVLAAAYDSVERAAAAARAVGVSVEPMYFSLNDPDELSDLSEATVPRGKGAVLSGAVMVGRTRLIDNVVFEYPLNP